MTTAYSRWFLVIGSLYLLMGIGIGMYMGGSGDHRLTPVHAHINLAGFVLMTVFGLIYRAIPGMAGDVLAKAHFWLFQIGALILVSALYLMVSERMAEASIGPILLVAEILVYASLLAFALNLYRKA